MESRPPRESFVELRPRPEPELLAARATAPPATRRATAVIVVHGMGQQVKFETLEQVANALRSEDAARHGRPQGPRVTVDMVMLGETRLPRAELRVSGDDDVPREVHLYESYWAPVTEGRVTLRDTFEFLLRSGVNSLMRVGDRTFDRWMFGRWVSFLIHRGRTAVELLGVLIVLGSLIFMNAVIGAVMTSHTLTGGAAPWPRPELFRQLTLDLAMLIPAAAGIVLGCVAVPQWIKGGAPDRNPATPRPFSPGRDPVTPRPGSLAGWALVLLGLLGIVLIAVFMLIHVIHGPGPVAAKRAFGPLGSIGPGWTLVAWVVWLAAIGVSLGARWFLIEYVGDVAAYISSHTVSKFWDVRHQIHEISMAVARPVYGARVPGAREHLYDRVVVVGHSLGSVVAYDMLNDLILEDRLKQLPYDAAHRTGMLITFGSPLEKTAYLFRTQRPHLAEVREALAAAVQPMIQSYVSRPRFWVNLFSPNDWISGQLRFYDAEEPAEGGSRRVENIVDPDADRPLMAHNQYWTNPLLAAVLLDGVTGEWAPGVRGEQGSRAARRGV